MDGGNPYVSQVIALTVAWFGFEALCILALRQ
jgi:hypothetical protein